MTNILSIDGGGIRGIIPLVQLRELENIIKCTFFQKFDFITGTSTGGIIAVMLSLGYTTDDILHFYQNYGPKIFDKKPLRWGIFKPKYNAEDILQIFKDVVGNKTLLDCKTNIIIPTYNLSKIGQPQLLGLFKSHKAKQDPDKYNFNLVDVLRATSSAPTYWKPHNINGDYFDDGGMIVNSPSMIAKYEALDEGYTNLNIISFACGRKRKEFNIKNYDGGAAERASSLIDSLLDSQQFMTDYYLQKDHKRGELKYMRINSIVHYSDGSIDNASEENIANMILDGEMSLKINKKLLQTFHKSTFK